VHGFRHDIEADAGFRLNEVETQRSSHATQTIFIALSVPPSLWQPVLCRSSSALASDYQRFSD